MNKTKILLFIPVIILLGWVVSIQTAVSTGTTIVLPVRGFDPRDIFAGRYLAVSVDYGAFESECAVKQGKERWKKTEAFFCPDIQKIVLNKPAECAVFIKGYCRYGRFNDNVSRFYIPEKLSRPLEQAVRNPENNPQLRLRVSRNGRAYPQDLILSDLPFEQWLEKNKSPSK